MDETAQQRILELVSSIIRQGHELHGLLNERMREPWLNPVDQEINVLQMEVTKAYGIPFWHIVGKSRLARDAQARLVAMSLCRQLTSATLEQVAKRFHRHHSSVLYAEGAIRERASVDPKFRSQFEETKKRASETLAKFRLTKKLTHGSHDDSLAG